LFCGKGFEKLWENPLKADGTPKGLLEAFNFRVHWAIHLCLISTALDPISTSHIEDLAMELKKD